MPDESLMTDEEVCEFLRMSMSTVYRHLANGPPVCREGAGDIRTIKRCKVGGVRRWVRSSVLEFANAESPQQQED